MNKVHFTSISDEWETPQDLFEKYNTIYHFQLDAAATKENTKCKDFFTKEDNALVQNWSKYQTVWLNPPYGRKIGFFIKKAYEESLKDVTIVCLIPARTDTKYFHDYCLKYGKVEFLRGRLRFINRLLPSYKKDGDFKSSPAPFPSCIVIFGLK